MQGEDLGPLELKIDTLQKQISDSVERCADMQGHWLRQQNELVRKTREAEEETAAVDSLRKQQLILQQKKMRIDGLHPPPSHTHTLCIICACGLCPIECTVWILYIQQCSC